MKYHLTKIASSTLNVHLPFDVVVGNDIPAVPGTVVAVRVLDTKSTYNHLENIHGRMMSVRAGDLIAGVLGNRQALHGHAGVVPAEVKSGDVLHLLNLGGIIGLCTSSNPAVGPACRVEILGSILHFPELGRRVGKPANILPGPVKLTNTLPDNRPPAIFFAGTCMHAGKTAAASIFIREASARGLRIGAAKVTGVALRRDALEMEDHGAVRSIGFTDAGLPSTDAESAPQVARSCIASLSENRIDLLVVELGDGIMGSYGVAEILQDDAYRGTKDVLALAANDPVGAWGGTQWLNTLGWSAAVITGPATDNEVCSQRISEQCGVPAINARRSASDFAACLLNAVGLKEQGE